ncbi:DedA family protein [Vallicoccus soli]|uniref:DedA family protein n=1 Tax=Vallicoccus soli TaxID=2339232 RepID=A0A3A3YSG7_9ACTN|nr:VTT domain-containing protein [Vallicoccus soli]RJK94291.1 DedA family protein [Vallicoccus soli]
MPTTLALGPSWLDPEQLITTGSLLGVLLIVFAESGLLVGFFLPGDSLLFTLGLLIAGGTVDVPLWLALVLVPVAAIVGDQVGYAIGRKAGPAVFRRPDSRFFKQEHVDKAYSFFDRYGGRTIVLARFVPIVRTFAPVVAGVGRMRYRTFVAYNVLGGVLWGAGVTALGYWLGQIAFVREHIEAILIGIVLVSVVPVAVELLRARSRSRDERYDEEHERARVHEEDIA